MNPVQALRFQEFITADGDVLTTDSLRVAAVHGKRHNNVLALNRQRIAEAGEWGLLNFKETPFVGSNGETYAMYVMTQAGYQFLVGRMTGKKATEHRWRQPEPSPWRVPEEQAGQRAGA